MNSRIPLTLAIAAVLASQHVLLAQGEGPIGTLGFDGRSSAYPSGLSASVFRARMSPANEVPRIDGNNASARATISVIRGGTASDQINFVEFQVDYNISTVTKITGLHIHAGEAGVNGPIVVDSGLPGGPIDVQPNRPGTIKVIVRDNQVATDIEKNPSGYYINLHTEANPGGLMRGQLTAATQIIAGADLRTGNENPPIPQDGIATGIAIATITRDSAGVIDSAEIRFLLKYSFPAVAFLGPQTFTGLHIHSGGAGVNGPVILDSGLNAALGLQVSATGKGSLDLRNELTLNDNVRTALEALSKNTGAYYMNVHTNGFPGGFARGQVSTTSRVILGVSLSRDGASEAAQGSFVADVVRNRKTGNIEYGLASFAVLHRNFPAGTRFTGLHIHEGGSNVNGPVKIDSGLSGTNFVDGGGAPGFISTSSVMEVTDASTVSAMQDMATNLRDQGYYMNLHTVVQPGGAIRGQMGSIGIVATSDFNRVDDVTSDIGLDPPVRALAPGSRVAIYGSFLAVPGGQDTDKEGAFFATALNGTSVLIDGKSATIISVDTTQIHAVVPFDVAPGGGRKTLQVGLINGTLLSNPVQVDVQRYAPAIFITEGGAELLREQGGLVRQNNPARAGERILVFATGLGQTSPQLFDGIPAPTQSEGGIAVTDTVTATIGGTNARVISSTALPGFVGKYMVTIEVPAGTGTGDQPLELRIGGAASNRVAVAITR